MPAEKLTKKRLIQILIMMSILLSAFIYRSCNYEQIQKQVQSAQQK